MYLYTCGRRGMGEGGKEGRERGREGGKGGERRGGGREGGKEEGGERRERGRVGLCCTNSGKCREESDMDS